MKFAVSTGYSIGLIARGTASARFLEDLGLTSSFVSLDVEVVMTLQTSF